MLIHGASGGVGVAATQFAVAAGATVIGTARHRTRLAVVRAQGAHHASITQGAGLPRRDHQAAGGRGPDVILEMLANVNLDHDLTVVAPGGRIVVIGNRGRVEIDARKIMTKDVSVFGLALWGIPSDEVRRAHRRSSPASKRRAESRWWERSCRSRTRPSRISGDGARRARRKIVLIP